MYSAVPDQGTEPTLQPDSEPQSSSNKPNKKSKSNKPRPRFVQILIKIFLGDNLLLTLTMAAVLIGGMSGYLIGKYANSGYPGHPVTPRTRQWIKVPGDLFLRALSAVILPLIMFTVAYILITTLIAVAIGMVIVMLIKPALLASDSMFDLFSNTVPSNLVEMTFTVQKTCPIPKRMVKIGKDEYVEVKADIKDDSLKKEIYAVLKTEDKPKLNIIGVVSISVLFGVIINRVGDNARPLKDFFLAVEAVTMTMVSAIIWFSPIGIGFLLCESMIKAVSEDLTRLLMYILTCVTGLLIHGVIVLPLIYLVIVRSNPLRFMKGCIPAYLTAFGTASSSGTMPVTMRCLLKANKMNRDIVNFVIPLGTTLNMDGTALYEAVGSIYLMQLVTGGLPTFGDILIASFTAIVASIGAAGIPSAGMVTMIIVLISLGVPEGYVAWIAPMEFICNVPGLGFGDEDVLPGNRRAASPSAADAFTNADVVVEEPYVEDSAVEPPLNISTQPQLPN